MSLSIVNYVLDHCQIIWSSPNLIWQYVFYPGQDIIWFFQTLMFSTISIWEALYHCTQITPESEFGIGFINLNLIRWELLLMQEKVSFILIGLLASVFAWELQEDLLISMRSQGQGLYIEMWRLATFWLMESYARKYQILDWQSFMMILKPTSAPELQGPCKLLIHFLKAILSLMACFILYHGA